MRFGETGPRERRRWSGLLTDTDMTGERRGTTGGPETAGEKDEEVRLGPRPPAPPKSHGMRKKWHLKQEKYK